MTSSGYQRRLPIGAEVLPDGGVHFRVWAPRRRRVEVALESGDGGAREFVALQWEDTGYFSGHVARARAGTLYRFRLDGDDYLYPDPASRFQPEGPHGPSRVVDPTTFRWTDAEWRGAALRGQVIYELHVGTFTPEGTWAAATRQLAELAEAGITCVEMMPVADFPGRFGWGYDGVDMFAPTRLYGEPDDLRRFNDEAHRLGLAVILDVVYNHLGPDGNYLMQFSEHYLSERHHTEWGDALNFDGEHARHVREFFISNAGYWVDEYHFDGLRLDATQQIFDDSEVHILTEVAGRVREAARERATFVVAENEAQETRLVRAHARGGCGLDGVWNDDFHHSARVALTGHNEAYYTDFHGHPQEFISAVKWGYLFQGQHYAWQRKRRGEPAFGVPPEAFVTFIENHDQVSNSAWGRRLHQLTDPASYRAMTALLLLAPGTPMLFQGQEFASSAPFVYFADHEENLARLVREGRFKFLAQFPSVSMRETQERLYDPADPQTFERCKLDLTERTRHGAAYALHKDLIRLRRTDPVFGAQRPRGVDGAVLDERAFLLRFFAEGDEGDRLLVVNLGADLRLEAAPEPLLAPPEGMHWQVLWSSEDPRYGGSGTPPTEHTAGWYVPGRAAVALVARTPSEAPAIAAPLDNEDDMPEAAADE